MTYSESAAGIKIDAKRAAREIKAHGIDPAEFFAEYGIRKLYSARAVLNWLGY